MSILVEIFEKFKFRSQFPKNLDFGLIFRNLKFGRNFFKISLWSKFSKISKLVEIF